MPNHDSRTDITLIRGALRHLTSVEDPTLADLVKDDIARLTDLLARIDAGEV